MQYQQRQYQFNNNTASINITPFVIILIVMIVCFVDFLIPCKGGINIICINEDLNNEQDQEEKISAFDERFYGRNITHNRSPIDLGTF